jgi:energy-coupling factor transporter ATP-binding protein EcfA2
MSALVLSQRWRGGIGAGKSKALRSAVSEAMISGVRPLAYLPTVTDVGLRTERVDLPREDFVEQLGVAPLVGRLTRSLSSGERQRVRLASALSSSVRFAALDEPCRHLDPRHVEALNRVLALRIQDGLTLLACDAREMLDPFLFEHDNAVLPGVDHPPEPCAPPSGDPLALDIPTPFTLSSTARKTGKRSVEIERGALVVVRGPNGSGKTSLLEALANAAARSRLRVGFSRQEPEHQVFTTSLQREVNDVAAAHDGAPWCQIEGSESDALGLLIANLGLDRWRERPTPRLPLGVLGLLGTAVALWMGHDLVLLDEPTQMLDTLGSEALARELVRCSAAGARIVVATHDPGLIRVANRGWTVDAGTLHVGQNP